MPAARRTRAPRPAKPQRRRRGNGEHEEAVEADASVVVSGPGCGRPERPSGDGQVRVAPRSIACAGPAQGRRFAGAGHKRPLQGRPLPRCGRPCRIAELFRSGNCSALRRRAFPGRRKPAARRQSRREPAFRRLSRYGNGAGQAQLKAGTSRHRRRRLPPPVRGRRRRPRPLPPGSGPQRTGPGHCGPDRPPTSTQRR